MVFNLVLKIGTKFMLTKVAQGSQINGYLVDRQSPFRFHWKFQFKITKLSEKKTKIGANNHSFDMRME